jgi:activator of HSP90 ATPase
MDFKAAPHPIYAALLRSRQFAPNSGAPAEIDRREGGAFSLFGDQTAGRTIKPVPDKRIVQAWRPSHWDQGVYSIARFELNQGGAGTTLILDHTGFPQGDYDGLPSGWHEDYERGLREISP